MIVKCVYFFNLFSLKTTLLTKVILTGQFNDISDIFINNTYSNT